MPALLPIDAETPRSLVINPPLTDAEFEALCARQRVVPLRADQRRGNSDAPTHRRIYQRRKCRNHCPAPLLVEDPSAGKGFDSNGTFFLPDGSMLNPDAAYVLPHRLKGLTEDDLTGFPRLCPDFVVELLSKSDSVPKAKQKMERWIENGATLGLAD